jgi:hypothetical protein
MSQIQDPLNIVLYGEYKPSIQTLLEQKHYGPALTLIFSCIDMLAHISRAPDQEKAFRADYIQWINTYFDFHRIPGEYIYSARCAIIHTFGVESDSTRKSKSPQIGFCLGGNKPVIYRPDEYPDLMIIEIMSFAHAFYNAIDRFYISFYSNPELIKSRAEELLQSIPFKELKEEFAENME